MVSEARVTKQCKKYFDKLRREYPDFFFQKISDRFASGLPDYYILFRGISMWIELKAEGQELRAIQNHTMKKLHEAGAITLWTSDFKQVKQLVNDVIGIDDIIA